MTRGKLLQSKERVRLQKMTARLGMSQDDKAERGRKKQLERRDSGRTCLLMKKPR